MGMVKLPMPTTPNPKKFKQPYVPKAPKFPTPNFKP